MYAAVHPWAVINGGIMHEGFRRRAPTTCRRSATIQNSGIVWGFGTDGTAANQYLPFTTLYFAVTGKMPGGMKVIRQTISREDALIAHTRKNAFLVFQEDTLGSIQPGKLADLVVLDRDYLTIPADQIKDIKPVMTMVGGRIVYDGPFLDTIGGLCIAFSCASVVVFAARGARGLLAAVAQVSPANEGKTAEQVYKNIKVLRGHAGQRAESVDAPDEGRRRPGLRLLPHRARVGKGRQAGEGSGARR